MHQVRRRDASGLSALHEAVATSNIEMVQRLCKIEAKMVDFDNHTPLHLAIETEKWDLVPYLVDGACMDESMFLKAVSYHAPMHILKVLFVKERMVLFG